MYCLFVGKRTRERIRKMSLHSSGQYIASVDFLLRNKSRTKSILIINIDSTFFNNEFQKFLTTIKVVDEWIKQWKAMSIIIVEIFDQFCQFFHCRDFACHIYEWSTINETKILLFMKKTETQLCILLVRFDFMRCCYL